ncbi:MAG TPA: helix-turn-helix domain-containing protein [Tepidisphaeraceae bacterium]|jgi:DNA-binding transcriptional MerR regulator|nr:helix-turn-helix domain-containing protein [Tepidisphaeraceae bacterium]
MVDQKPPKDDAAPVTVDVVAAELHVTDKTIRKWRRVYGLPFKKIGGVLLFDLHDVRRWFKEWNGNGHACK